MLLKLFLKINLEKLLSRSVRETLGKTEQLLKKKDHQREIRDKISKGSTSSQLRSIMLVSES